MDNIYFAHEMCDHGQLVEAEAMLRIGRRWVRQRFNIINPNHPRHAKGFIAKGMEYYDNVIHPYVDISVFMRMPNGKIGAGVVSEIDKAFQSSLPVFEVTRDGRYLIEVDRVAWIGLKEAHGLDRYKTHDLNDKFDPWLAIV